MKFFQVKSVEETFRLIQEKIKPLKTIETVSLWQSRGRVLAEDIYVKESVPAFRRSSVDGYAVLAEDTFGASESMPAFLNMIGEVKMGEHVQVALQAGEAMYVPTGGMLPDGANGVVMIEHCEETANLVNVYKQIAPYENVIQPGEDLSEGNLLLEKGTKLRAQEIGALASQGIYEVSVMKKPVVAYISSGDEIVPFETQNLKLGEIRDMNALTIGTLTEEWGCHFLYGGIVKDDERELERRAKELLEKADCLVLSGGSSVGTKDYSVDIIHSLGQPGVFVHGIAVKPGKPTILSMADEKPVIGLPGHPASALIIYKLFGSAILHRLEGKCNESFMRTEAFSTKKIASSPGRTDYVRVRLVQRNQKLYAEPIHGKSGLISTLVESDGILEIPSQKEGIEKDEKVSIIRFL